MIRGLFISAKAMSLQEVRYQTVAQNLANVSTAGYRRQTVAFHAFAEQAADRMSETRLATPADLHQRTFSVVTGSDTRTALMHTTGNRTDLALQGDAAFVLETPAGPAYTRAGAFTLDPQGCLVSPEGHPVLGTRGPITITSADWEIGPNGDVLVAGKVVDRLRFAQLDPATTRMGGNLVRSDAVEATAPVRVQQGALEGSNVNAITEMTTLIETTRQFEACQRCMLAVDSTLDRTVNEVGRI